jgi:hypothetical protein
MTHAPAVIFKIPKKIPQPGRGNAARPAARGQDQAPGNRTSPR